MTRLQGAVQIGLSLLFSFALASCQLATLFSPAQGQNSAGGGATISLAEGILGDFIAKIQTTTFSRSLDSNNKLSQSDLEDLKTIIRKKISDDGLGASESLDDVLPAVMAGITAGVKNLRQADGDSAISAQLLAKALQASSESLGKNSGKASSTSNLPAILQKAVRKGAEELAVIAKDDPESASAALKSAVKEVADALKSKAGLIDEVSVLKAVVTGSVQAVVQGGSNEMVQAVFAGTASTTTVESVVTEVVKEAVVKAMDGDSDGTLLDSTKATEILKQAAAGLGSSVASDTVLDAAQQELQNNAVTVDDAAMTEVKTIRAETDPTASLSLTVDGAAYTEGAELAYSASARTIALTTGNASGTTEQLVGPDGNDLTLSAGSATFNLTGSGAYRFILLVKNTSGIKSAYKSVVVRVAPLPEEVAPTASLTVMEGSTIVSGPLAWSKDAHSLTFDTTGSTATGVKTFILSDSPSAIPTESGGVWSVTQKYGTVNYTLVIKNVGGSKVTKVTKAVTIAAEPSVTAVLKAYNGEAEITAPLPRQATYSITLKSAGTTAGTVQEVSSSPAASITKVSEGVWTATVLATVGTYTFTLVAKTDGGMNKAQATRVVSIAPEQAPVAALTIKKDGVAVTASLPYQEGGYDLVLDPAGSTTANTDLTLVDDRNLVVVHNANGTWTAKAVQQTTSFTLTVKNQGGALMAQAVKTVVVGSPTDTNVSADVAAGREAVKQHQWTAAKTAFAAALVKNPNDTDAKIWSAFLDLATLAVHPQVVGLLRDRVGVADYPDTMENLLTTNWMTSVAQNNHSGYRLVKNWSADRADYYYIRGNVVAGTGSTSSNNSYYPWGSDAYSNTTYVYGTWDFVPDANGSAVVVSWLQSDGTYLRAPEYATATTVALNQVYETYYYFLRNQNLSPLPRLAPVEGFERLDTNDDGTPANGKEFGVLDYFRLLGANVLSRNPLGFNDMVDQVVTGPFGSSLDSIVNRLTSLGATDRTLIPADLLDQVTSRFGIDSTALPPVTIGKPELLLLGAQLKMSKSFVQYLASVNMNYPVGQALVDSFTKLDRPDSDGDGFDDLSQAIYNSTPGFTFSGFLKDRNNTMRASSKATFLSGLDDVTTALGLYETLIADETGGYRTGLAPMIVAMVPPSMGGMVPTHQQVLDILANFVTQLNAFRTSVADNTDLVVNANLIAPMALNPFEALLGHFPTDDAWVVRPGEVWANSIMDPRFWFEGSSTDGLTLYLEGRNWSSGKTSEGEFLKLLPADRTKLTPAFFELTSTDTTGTSDREINATTAFKLKRTSLQKFYPAANPSDRQLGVPFGASWNVVDSRWVWNSSTFSGGFSYTYTMQPPIWVTEYWKWINKK